MSKYQILCIPQQRLRDLMLDDEYAIQMTDEKIIRATTPMHTGDIVDYRNERYLITSQVDQNKKSCRGRMKKCNQRLALNWNGQVKRFDAVVEARVFSVEAGKLISVPEGNILVSLEDNVDTKGITLSQRFYMTRRSASSGYGQRFGPSKHHRENVYIA